MKIENKMYIKIITWINYHQQLFRHFKICILTKIKIMLFLQLINAL